MAILLAVSIVIFLLAYLYWRALPKPLAGIPHNAASANRLSGDLPGLLAHYKQTKEIASFSFQQCHSLGSPVIQLFLRPFSRPFIWLNDPRETEDILLRRTKEFDRAPSTIAMFKPLVPHASMVKTTNDEFKQQRRLWQDVMSPDFLRTVVAPNVHQPVLELVELWRLKTKLALNHPFEALDDLELAAFDAIWVAILGSKLNGTRTEIEHLEHLESQSAVLMPPNDDDEIHLPTAPRSTMFRAIAYINSTMERIMRSPFPKYYHWILRQNSTYKYYDGYKNREIMGLVHKARDRFQKLSKLAEEEASEYDACAMDLVLRREVIAARKTAVPLAIAGDLEMRDELGMLLVAVSQQNLYFKISFEILWQTKSSRIPGPRNNSHNARMGSQNSSPKFRTPIHPPRNPPLRLPEQHAPFAPLGARNPFQQHPLPRRLPRRDHPFRKHGAPARPREHHRHQDPWPQGPQGHARHVQCAVHDAAVRYPRASSQPQLPGRREAERGPVRHARSARFQTGALARNERGWRARFPTARSDPSCVFPRRQGLLR